MAGMARKLTDDDVRKLMADRECGMSYRALARQYAVSVFGAHYAVHVRWKKLQAVEQGGATLRQWLSR
jgi:hypothetical protein